MAPLQRAQWSSFGLWVVAIVVIAMQCKLFTVAHGSPIPWSASFGWAVKDWAFWAIATPLTLPWLDRSCVGESGRAPHVSAIVAGGLVLCAASTAVSIAFAALANVDVAQSAVRHGPRALGIYVLTVLSWTLIRLYSAMPAVAEPRRTGGFWITDGPQKTWVSHTAITRLTARGNYVEVIEGARLHLVRRTLRDLSADLPSQFERVHRSHIVNLDGVRALERQPKGTVRIVLTNGDEVPVSRKYQPALADRLRNA